MTDRSRPFIGRPVAAHGHMPFAGHRTQAEVREDEERNAIRRSLGRNGKRKAKAS